MGLDYIMVDIEIAREFTMATEICDHYILQGMKFGIVK